MPQSFHVVVLLGSLRANSFSSRVAAAIAAVAPPSLHFKTVATGDLPLYNQDLDGDAAPAAYAPFRDAIRKADAVLFVSPEYNRGVPGNLKNAIDVASRPYGHGPIIGKPAGVITQSPGGIGGIAANHAIRQSLVFLNMPVVQQPEAYLGSIMNAFGEDGSLNDDGLKDLLTRFAQALEALIIRHK